MSDEAPSPFKGIYLFSEFVALGCILEGVSALRANEFHKGWIFIGIGFVIISMVCWIIAKYKSRKKSASALHSSASESTRHVKRIEETRECDTCAKDEIGNKKKLTKKQKVFLVGLFILLTLEGAWFLIDHYTEAFEENTDKGAVSPHRIIREIMVANSPMERKNKTRLFAGVNVDWKLYISYISVSGQISDARKDQLFVGFYEYKNVLASNNASVVFYIPTNGNEFLRLSQQYEQFRVRGTISDINDLNQIELENVSVEMIDGPKQPSKAPGKAAPPQ